MSSATSYVDLVTKTGEIVRIECPARFDDDLHETIENAMKRRDWWSPSQFNDCKATYLGLSLEKVNMGEIVGIL